MNDLNSQVSDEQTGDGLLTPKESIKASNSSKLIACQLISYLDAKSICSQRF